MFTRWESEEAFQTWLSGDDFAKAHAHVAEEANAMAEDAGGHPHAEDAEGGHPHGGSHAHGGPVAVAAELLAFEVMERVTRD